MDTHEEKKYRCITEDGYRIYFIDVTGSTYSKPHDLVADTFGLPPELYNPDVET